MALGFIGLSGITKVIRLYSMYCALQAQGCAVGSCAKPSPCLDESDRFEVGTLVVTFWLSSNKIEQNTLFDTTRTLVVR